MKHFPAKCPVRFARHSKNGRRSRPGSPQKMRQTKNRATPIVISRDLRALMRVV
jgi:hypothetical protein